MHCVPLIVARKERATDPEFRVSANVSLLPRIVGFQTAAETMPTFMFVVHVVVVCEKPQTDSGKQS